MRKVIYFFTYCFLLSYFNPSVSVAQGILQDTARIRPVDGADGFSFGGVSISGTEAIVGDPLDNSNAGAAYLFEKDQGGTGNWGQVTKFTANGSPNRYGGGVAIDGDTIAIFHHDTIEMKYRDHPSADQWGLKKSISLGWSASYGVRMVLQGDTLVIARATSNPGVSVYKRNNGGTDNWGLVKVLSPSDGVASDIFGANIAVSPDEGVIVINSSKHRHTPSHDTGALYVYEKDSGGTNNWGETKKIYPTGTVSGPQFGLGVSTTGDRIAASDFSTESLGDKKFYVYERDAGGTNNWGLEKQVTVDLVTERGFSTEFDSTGDFLIVAVPKPTSPDNVFGSAVYTYEKDVGGVNNWGLVNKLVICDGAITNQHHADPSLISARHMQLSGGYALLSATHDDFNGTNTGSAYLMEYLGQECSSGSCLFPGDIILPATIVENDPALGVNEYEADESAAGLVQNSEQYLIEDDANVRWTSSTGMVLNSGFRVELGGRYEAVIDPNACS